MISSGAHMDIGRIFRLTRLALEADGAASVSGTGSAVVQALSQLSSGPAETSYQQTAVAALDSFKQALKAANKILTPEEILAIEDLADAPLFTETLGDEVAEALRESPATPTTARDVAQGIVSKRELALARFRQFITTGSELRWDIEEPEDWNAEVSFQLPRSLFDNQFDGLIGELRYIRRLLQHLSELDGGAAAEVQLASLSTTDPLIALGVCLYLAKQVGNLTKWALEQWKSVEEIRNIRAQTRKLAAFSEEEVDSIFSDKIKKQIDAGVEAKVAELIAPIAETARGNELGNALRKDLPEYLGRIERGMRVEVRLISAPVVVEGEETSPESEMQDLANDLKFPPASTDPVLQITRQGPA